VLQHEFEIESNMSSSGQLAIRIVGELDADTAHTLGDTVGEWLGITECEIDLSECTFVDSHGLTALLVCRHEIGESTPMRLVGLQPYVEHVLRIAGLQTILGLDT
jgi:anti-anti-sigma factor